jgi:hypothetical protein
MGYPEGLDQISREICGFVLSAPSFLSEFFTHCGLKLPVWKLGAAKKTNNLLNFNEYKKSVKKAGTAIAKCYAPRRDLSVQGFRHCVAGGCSCLIDQYLIYMRRFTK